ncbi:M61 family peptidase [Lacibacter luteus]|uniref:M61 family peptidase n=1 Tax=Lacibacter luteus TaxID=2508719 RepID=A0A4Q1CFT6_9BACT|nr:M61 family metallopeptidase [Lacibacter luteus]RXK58883.1 M61 family peptidase [Lacibacter luteus]
MRRLVSTFSKCCNVAFVIAVLVLTCNYQARAGKSPVMHYSISFPKPETHSYHVQLQTSGWASDSLHFKLPKWTPGYYQLMKYADDVQNINARDQNGKTLTVKKINENTWSVVGSRQKTITVEYDIKTSRQFVANSYVDSLHAYVIPANTFLYVDGFLQMPVSVKVNMHKQWPDIATGLMEQNATQKNVFAAANFDELYDCPILIGKLQALPSFTVKGIEHRFIGYQMSNFDQQQLMDHLHKIIETTVTMMGDIPYKRYTFIGIGPGRGGIEHLNNTTVSFDGKGLNTAAGMNQILNFLTHEYFHHFNVKRIRPFELGPFNYDAPVRTNLLWISEGLTVYYEYLLIKRAGLMTEQQLFSNIEHNINAVENSPGRQFQSLMQASYNTWADGPFGTQGREPGKAISYYDKGPVVGLLLDFTIRNATQNKQSLDNVMQLLYNRYYKQQQRGFTDAEFQQTCEEVARVPLTSFFEYIYSTKELDYKTCLGYAGLRLEESETTANDGKKTKRMLLARNTDATALQNEILQSWINGK